MKELLEKTFAGIVAKHKDEYAKIGVMEFSRVTLDKRYKGILKECGDYTDVVAVDLVEQTKSGEQMVQLAVKGGKSGEEEFISPFKLSIDDFKAFVSLFIADYASCFPEDDIEL